MSTPLNSLTMAQPMMIDDAPDPQMQEMMALVNDLRSKDPNLSLGDAVAQAMEMVAAGQGAAPEAMAEGEMPLPEESMEPEAPAMPPMPQQAPRDMASMRKMAMVKR